MEQQSFVKRMKPEANMPMTREMKQQGNALMAQRILQMSDVPYEDGKYVYRVVEIRGRKSGEIRQVPLAVFQYEGMHYLIAPQRSRDWVQNLLVADECVLMSRTQREHCHATLTFDLTALAAVRAYIGQLAWASQQFPFSVADTDESIRLQSEQFAIFRLFY